MIAIVSCLMIFILTSWTILSLPPALIPNLEVCGLNSSGKTRYFFDHFTVKDSG